MLQRFIYSITFKAIVVGVLTLLMLIPAFMIQDLISERKLRSEETVAKINDKWSAPQTLYPPVLSIPYKQLIEGAKDDEVKYEMRVMNISPQELEINATIEPEERYYGIYKAILYKSSIDMSGYFRAVDILVFPARSEVQWGDAYVSFAVSDLRGVTQNPNFDFDGKMYTVSAGGGVANQGKRLVAKLTDVSLQSGGEMRFTCNLTLNGSGSIGFIPIGQSTTVLVSGVWADPGFVGSFSPEYTIENNKFSAKWGVLNFNRDIPYAWSEPSGADVLTVGQRSAYDFTGSYFGLNLVDKLDNYQQNMRSAKYAFMFVALTFLVFFFVELITKRKIHPIQYLLVGFALMMFYTLLLSMSEHIGFALSYLISSVATIAMIVAYSNTIFKTRKQTSILALLLIVLYIFLYVILQLEDMALLIGSIVLFIILGTVMCFSRKINWDREASEGEDK